MWKKKGRRKLLKFDPQTQHLPLAVAVVNYRWLQRQLTAAGYASGSWR
jgi:hypothetical protein